MPCEGIVNRVTGRMLVRIQSRAPFLESIVMGVWGSSKSRNRGNGISSHSSESGFRTETVYVDKPQPKLPNPDPFNFRVLMEQVVGNYLVVWVLYPDATNFEGLKILLLESVKTVISVAKK